MIVFFLQMRALDHDLDVTNISGSSSIAGEGAVSINGLLRYCRLGIRKNPSVLASEDTSPLQGRRFKTPLLDEEGWLAKRVGVVRLSAAC